MKRGALIVACIGAWLAIAWLLSDRGDVRASGPALAPPETGPFTPSQAVAALSLPGERKLSRAPLDVALETSIETYAPVRESARTEEPVSRELLEGLFADLRNDNVRGNAGIALYQLEDLMAIGPLARAAIRERAERALDSYDVQEADLCTELLLRCALHAWHDVDRAPPHPRAIRLAADMLAGGRVRDYGMVYRPVSRHSMEIAIAYPEALEPWVVPQLRHVNPRHRRTAAIALACARRTEHAARIVDVLLPSLWDNDTTQDGLTAAFALKQLGSAALPHIPPPGIARDDQERFFLQAIRMEIESPGSSLRLGSGPGVSECAPNAPLVEWRPRFGVRRD